MTCNKTASVPIYMKPFIVFYLYITLNAEGGLDSRLDLDLFNTPSGRNMQHIAVFDMRKMIANVRKFK